MPNTADSLQNAAIAKADALSVQMQQFINILLGDSLIGSGIVPIDSTLDIGDIQTALTNLLASAQLNPPVPLQVASLPTITPPILGPVNAAVKIPTFPTISAPKIVNPVAPIIGKDVFTASRPPIATLTAPARPTITLPKAPSFNNVVMPTITDIVMPTLSAIAPVDALTAPSNLFMFSENAYQSALLDSSKAKLLHDMQFGGYGIETADEDALWARARDRELRTAAIASADVARSMAARGFTLPPGAALAQLASIQQDSTEKLSTVSRDIALKRADMYVENRKFTISETRELEQILIGANMAVMERALNASKATAEFGIALYNARISRFNILMEGFKTQVIAYGEQVRAAVSQLEAQKVKLEVSKTEVEVQRAQAEIYKTQVEGQTALMGMYRTDIAALQGLADVERLKLDAFRADVEVFSEQLRAGTLQLQGYEAQTRGNLAQAEIYKTQIDSQVSQVEITKAQAAIVESNARVSVENVRAAIAVIQSQAEIYRAQTQGVASSNEAQGRAFAARTEAFRTIAGVYGEMGKIKVAGADMTLRAAIEQVHNEVELARIATETRVQAASSAAGAIGQQIQAQLGQVLGIASAITQSS